MNGFVLKRIKGFYKVLDEGGGIHDCKIKRNLFRESKFDNQAAPGDLVEFKTGKGKDFGWILKIAPRKNSFHRKRVETEAKQVLAANVDQVLIFSSFTQPAFRKNLVLRMAVAALSDNIRPLVLLNKRDLSDEKNTLSVIDSVEKLKLGWQSHSNFIAEDKERVFKLLKGKKTVLCGHSGVGKSSLIKIFFPDPWIRVDGLNEKSGKGKHTTTASETYILENDTWIIDTPGIREFEPYCLDKLEIAGNFPPFLDVRAPCKFNDCLHRTEPGCTIKKEVEENRIPADIYESYLNLI